MGEGVWLGGDGGRGVVRDCVRDCVREGVDGGETAV